MIELESLLDAAKAACNNLNVARYCINQEFGDPMTPAEWNAFVLDATGFEPDVKDIKALREAIRQWDPTWELDRIAD